MLPAVSTLILLLAGSPSPVGGVSAPPGGTLDADLTRVYSERAAVETKEALAQLERDSSRTHAEKNDLKKRLAKLKIAVFTTLRGLDECVAVYEKTVPRSRFIFGERNLAADLEEGV